MRRRRAWVAYVEGKFGVTLGEHEGPVDLEILTATQSEIEAVKYDTVRYEGLRAGEPILVYKGRLGTYYVVDGHTRARVQWDLGARTMDAFVFTSGEMAVDAELQRIAVDSGGGKERRIGEVPIVDRVGRGSAAWERQRLALLGEWHAEDEPQA
jgi:hypothetical protein